jgi:hypothetical protein
MLRTCDVSSTVTFWKERGAKVLSPQIGKGSVFVGYGSYRDSEHFALELSPSAEPLTNNLISFIGLSVVKDDLPSVPVNEKSERESDDPLERFLAMRKRRSPPPGTDPSGISVKSVTFVGSLVSRVYR